ncbi:monocarboxylate transporter 13 [Apteryx rowi]|uniref:monocarboxylate transporter 13 n=1 Tax=Apteryx rowi TaxID=308060 RepID=UPI000E1C5310|nr:monocarboxylate transporter 13 [Apteryx rowi]
MAAPGPPDGGWGWVIVFGAFVQSALVFGVIRSLGVFVAAFGGAFGALAGGVSWVASLGIAVLQLGGPLGSALSTHFGTRPVVMAGGFLSGLGLFLGAFATHLAHLYLSVGLLAGLGWALVFTPSLAAVGRYFTSRRALATGLAVSGASFSSFALGPLVQLLMEAYGWRGALLLLAAISLNLVASGALLRPLVLPGESGTPGRPRCRPALPQLLRHGPFVRYVLAFILVDAGYYVPYVHGVARARELGCDEYRAALVMSVAAAADGGGRVFAGWLAARPAATLLWHLFAWAFLTGLALLFLPLGTSYAGLLALGLGYGFCAGAVAPLQFTALAEIVGARRLLHAIGLMQMFESLGSLLGAPLAGWLRDVTGNYTVSFITAGAFLVAGSLLLLTLPGFFTASPGSGSKEEGCDPAAPTPGGPEAAPDPPMPGGPGVI